MATSTVIDELLLRGADDWVPAAEVAWVAQSIGGAASDQGVLDTAIAAITHVVMNGLMEVGDVTDGGFFAWDMVPRDAVEKVARDWRALGRSPDLGEVCWLANTPAGDARADAIDQRGAR